MDGNTGGFPGAFKAGQVSILVVFYGKFFKDNQRA